MTNCIVDSEYSHLKTRGVGGCPIQVCPELIVSGTKRGAVLLNNTYLPWRLYRRFDHLDRLGFQVLLHLATRVCRTRVHAKEVGGSGVHEAPKIPDIKRDFGGRLSSSESCFAEVG